MKSTGIQFSYRHTTVRHPVPSDRHLSHDDSQE